MITRDPRFDPRNQGICEVCSEYHARDKEGVCGDCRVRRLEVEFDHMKKLRKQDIRAMHAEARLRRKRLFAEQKPGRARPPGERDNAILETITQGIIYYSGLTDHPRKAKSAYQHIRWLQAMDRKLDQTPLAPSDLARLRKLWRKLRDLRRIH